MYSQFKYIHLNNFNRLALFRYACLCNGIPVKIRKIVVTASMAPCCQIYRVTDEAFVAETAVWSIPFLINVMPAPKGTVTLFYFLFFCYTATHPDNITDISFQFGHIYIKCL